ncbi:hypothetical protein [Archangium lansingense]|uniref:Lipoprotein n=1 Tax=Archangium lansingense TaxID=2995310 RepID=A0ABT4AS78_9BACT|nr:hypothetical protein [Archangium lansinium]MCY1083709.1 hypothetical protein [Archangium lansinium]
MSKLLKSLLVAAAFLTLAPNTASALPPDCEDVCDEWAGCSDTCYYGRITTCGVYGVCGAGRAEPTEVTASVAQDDASSQVCSEEQPSAEQSASAES